MGNRIKAAWSRWGAECRRLRQQAGKTQDELADMLHVASVTVSSWETGRRAPNQATTERIDTALSTGGALTRLRAELISQHDVPEWFRDEITMERRAHEIRHYQPLVIPGLLQIESYARTLIASRMGKPTSEQVNKLVTTRISRRDELSDTDPLLWFVIRQAALEQPVGDSATMRKQLGDIADLAEQGHIRVQVLPSDHGTIGLCDAFRIMTLSDTQTVAFVEHALGSELYDAPDSVGKLTNLFGFISADALPHTTSIELIRTIIEDRYGHVD
jgi:transcriptional regulator with XRE-family HTH domain